MEQNVDQLFEKKRQHLIEMSDDKLKEHFWKLAEEIVQPMLDLGRDYTSPSIERSILLRMGFSSIEAMELVNLVMQKELMGKGAGHIVYLVSKQNNLSIREAGVALSEGKYWDQVGKHFNGGRN